MNVPGELADKVLQAGVRNVVVDVGEGDKMSAADRELMQMFAMTPELAQRMRAYKLVKRHIDGETLTAPQWAEVHGVYPEFRDGCPAPPAPAPETTSGAADFTLDAAPPSDELTKDQVARYMVLYGKTRRQIFRWRKEGAPLHDPIAMPGWWSRTHTWGVPAEIAAAAHAARNAALDPAPSEPAMAAANVTPDVTGLASAPAAASAVPIVAAGRSMPVFNLSELEFDPNQLVADAARRVAALNKRITAAYDGTSTEDADALESKLLKAVEGLRKLKDSDQKMKLAMGQYTLTADVERDLATLVELLRQMDETEARRVDELCPGLPQEARAQVRAAIMRVGEARRRIFRKLGTITSIQDALLDLAAA